MLSMKKVLIVVLNYETYVLTLKLIEELKNLTYPKYTIMVIDNCSQNKSAKVLSQAADEHGFLFIKNVQNMGYAAGNNIGIRYAIQNGYEYTWILNNDVKIQDCQILQKLIFSAEILDNIGCVGPQILWPNGNICAPYCCRPTLWSMTFGVMFSRNKRKLVANKSQHVYCVHGCCMLLKNSVMQQIDCMDEHTFLYCEEDILSERMRKVGAIAYYCANTSVIHMESATVSKVQSTKRKAQQVSQSMEIYLKDYRHFNLFSRYLCRLTRSLIILLRGR